MRIYRISLIENLWNDLIWKGQKKNRGENRNTKEKYNERNGFLPERYTWSANRTIQTTISIIPSIVYNVQWKLIGHIAHADIA